MQSLLPKVTIGMPVYNGRDTLRPVLDSLLAQSFADFELIISDNASTDDTADICKEYAQRDSRIRYVRQEKNIGVANFKFVFLEARGEYFLWAADDDIRSPEFLELNYKFLVENPGYVASTSPNGFENCSPDQEFVKFALDGDLFDRYTSFFKNSFQCHGLYYSLFRTKVLRDCEVIDQIYREPVWLGFDWATVLYLASKGKVNRTPRGYTIFGVNGDSGNVGIFKRFNTSTIERFLPFYRLSKFVLNLTSNLTLRQRIRILCMLAKLNLHANIEPIRWAVYMVAYRPYRTFIKPLREKWRHHQRAVPKNGK